MVVFAICLVTTVGVFVPTTDTGDTVIWSEPLCRRWTTVDQPVTATPATTEVHVSMNTTVVINVFAEWVGLVITATTGRMTILVNQTHVTTIRTALITETVSDASARMGGKTLLVRKGTIADASQPPSLPQRRARPTVHQARVPEPEHLQPKQQNDLQKLHPNQEEEEKGEDKGHQVVQWTAPVIQIRVRMEEHVTNMMVVTITIAFVLLDMMEPIVKRTSVQDVTCSPSVRTVNANVDTDTEVTDTTVTKIQIPSPK